MNGVRFGELPYLKQGRRVNVCTYSPDGRMLAIGAGSDLSIYDTTTWHRAYQHTGYNVSCAAFSPNNQQIVYATEFGHTLRLWNFANNDTALDLNGYSGWVLSVVFSPCGRQCASASKYETVRLWSAETGECMFVLDQHNHALNRGFPSALLDQRILTPNQFDFSALPNFIDSVTVVAYCRDGKRLVSGSSEDGTIRVCDPETGGPVARWNICCDYNSFLAFSADGQWVAVALDSGMIQITNTVTGESGP
ncbi:hypothetical protein BGX24_007483, partial [Mortierella sp. AD032]